MFAVFDFKAGACQKIHYAKTFTGDKKRMKYALNKTSVNNRMSEITAYLYLFAVVEALEGY